MHLLNSIVLVDYCTVGFILDSMPIVGLMSFLLLVPCILIFILCVFAYFFSNSFIMCSSVPIHVHAMKGNEMKPGENCLVLYQMWLTSKYSRWQLFIPTFCRVGKIFIRCSEHYLRIFSTFIGYSCNRRIMCPLWYDCKRWHSKRRNTLWSATRLPITSWNFVH